MCDNKLQNIGHYITDVPVTRRFIGSCNIKSNKTLDDLQFTTDGHIQRICDVFAAASHDDLNQNGGF